MPILTCPPEPPTSFIFQSHDHHQYKSLVSYFIRSHFPMKYSFIKKPYWLNARHRALFARKASNNNQSEPPPKPATKPSSAWKKWIVGVILSIILPSFRHKWAPLLMLKSKVDMAIETVESVAEAVEELAEGVEKVADEIGDRLPEDTKLKEAADLIENQAKAAVKLANKAEEVVHKVQEAEEELESALLLDQAKRDDPK